MTTIGIFTIATKHYIEHWKRLIESLDQVIFENIKIRIYIFTDNLRFCEDVSKQNSKFDYSFVEIPSLGWPEATLLRYRYISSIMYNCEEDVLMYLDADMLATQDFSELITGDSFYNGIALVSHPGFWRPKKLKKILFYVENPKYIISDIRMRLIQGALGSWERSSLSEAFVPRICRKNYVCGGVWLGRRRDFQSMVENLNKSVDEDLKNGFMAIWHDESHLNRWSSENCHTVLSPSYCYDETYPNLVNLKEIIRAVRK